MDNYPLISVASRRLLAILLSVSFAVVLLSRTRSYWSDSVPIARVPAALSPIDPNAASWWELAELPQIGESLARRIVDHRRRVPAPAFRNLQDLRGVPGIGPATLRRIAPDVCFPKSPNSER